jgi:hypothetical protein
MELEKSVQSPEGVVRESLKSVCTDANAFEIARYIVEVMRREADDETLDFDFHISGATGRMKVSEAYAQKNVWFKFDTKPTTLMRTVMNAEFDQDCNNAEYEYIEDFHRKICDHVEKDFARDVEHVLRDKIFMGKNVPCRLVRATAFECVPLGDVNPEENYQILIEKHVPQSKIDTSGSVSEELFKINLETGKGFNQIVKEKKASGDPRYQYVVGVTTKKMYWECQIDMFVDFSNDAPLGTPQV